MNHHQTERIPNTGIVPTGETYLHEEILPLSHGSWFTRSCLEPLRSSLSDEYRTIIPRIPIDQEYGDFNTCANAIAKQIEMSGAKKAVPIFHSRSGEMGPRVANRLQEMGISVEMQILICPGVSETTFGCLNKDGSKPPLPPKIVDERMHDLVEDRGLMSRLASRALAIELLFNGEEPPLDIETRLAIEGLRATRRTEHEPVMEEWPAGIPTGMIVARDDRVCNPERAIAFSRDWLGVEPEVIDGSHMVIMTHPSIVADTIRKMIANKENYLPSHAAKQAA